MVINYENINSIFNQVGIFYPRLRRLFGLYIANVTMCENAHETDVTNEGRKVSKVWSILLVAGISLARLGQGMFQALPGPTLLFLAKNTSASMAEISLVFTSRACGVIIGSLLFSGIKNRLPKFRPLFSVSIVMTLPALCSFAIPFCTKLSVVILVFGAAGTSLGYFECGLQSVYLQLWGEKLSRPYIQSFHFGYSIGALLAPLLARPFLRLANEVHKETPRCPNKLNEISVQYTTIEPFHNSTYIYNSTAEEQIILDGMSPVSWAYIIMGVYKFAMALTLFILAMCKVEERLEVEHIDMAEKRPEEPIKKIAPFLIIVALFFTTMVPTGNSYQAYIYSVAVCSDLNFSVTDASLLNTLFWAGLMVGRGLGIIAAKHLSPTPILLIDYAGAIISLIIITTWGDKALFLPWVVTFAFGFFEATVYSTSVSWVSRETNMTGSYMVTFSIGIGIGGMGLMPLAGAIFDHEPFHVLFYTLGLCLLSLAIFGGLEYYSCARKKRLTEINDAIKEGELDHLTSQ